MTEDNNDVHILAAQLWSGGKSSSWMFFLPFTAPYNRLLTNMMCGFLPSGCAGRVNVSAIPPLWSGPKEEADKSILVVAKSSISPSLDESRLFDLSHH